MPEPLTINLKFADVENLIKAASVCKEDLEIELSDRYPEKQRSDYPTIQRRFENDMAVVNQLDACITAIKDQLRGS